MELRLFVGLNENQWEDIIHYISYATGKSFLKDEASYSEVDKGIELIEEIKSQIYTNEEGFEEHSY